MLHTRTAFVSQRDREVLDRFLAAQPHQAAPAGPILMRGCNLEAFADLPALARRVQELRGKMGLERTPVTFAAPGYRPTLQGWALWAVDAETEGRTWLGTAWLAGASAAQLDLAVRAEGLIAANLSVAA